MPEHSLSCEVTVLAKKSGYSNKGLFGNINHYDSKGHKIGESRPNFFGGYSNYDAKGHKIGESRPNFFGGYTSYDTHGNKVGSSSPSFLGGEAHYDSQGHKIGSSSPSFLGSQNHTGSFSVSSELINQAGAAAGVERDMDRMLMAAANSLKEDSTSPTYPSVPSSSIDPPPKDGFFAKNPSPTQSLDGLVRYYVVQPTNHETAKYLAGKTLYMAGDWVYDSATGALMMIRSVFVCQFKDLPAEVMNHKLVKASPPINATLSSGAQGKTHSLGNLPSLVSSLAVVTLCVLLPL